MLDAVVTDAPGLDLPVVNRVLHGSPALQPGSLATVRAVQQEEVDVSEAAGLDGLLDRLARNVVRRVLRELRREVDVFPLETGRVGAAVEERFYGLSDLPFVVVHLRRVDAVSCVNGRTAESGPCCVCTYAL